jgi:transcriptional regulator with XRE-family HTH domain
MEATMTAGNRNDLARILRQQRVMRELTLHQLGEMSGVSSSHLGRIERGERFPSAHILRKIAKPLGLAEGELLTLAGYLSPQPSATVESETRLGRLDPYVATVLSLESVEVQRAVVGILSVLKSIAQAHSKPSELPEFREYVRRKYPELDEDIITMVQDIVEHPAKCKGQKQATDCPIGLDKIHCQNCYYWRGGKCDYKRIMEETNCQEHPPKG